MPAGNLTTLQNVKEYLGKTDNSSDPLLERLITAASASISQYTNRNLLTASYTETSDGLGNFYTCTKNFPVTAVASVTIDGVSIPISSGPLDNGFFFDAWGVGVRGCQFNRGRQNVTITYTAGYATIPADIEQACIDLVAMKFREKDRVGVRSHSVGPGGSTVYITMAMPDSVKAVLSNYIRRIPL